ncbi:hypothetical protein OPV22_034767 [Ensete ventricosum]|uniref:Uncharacterized protein n=1 Tax=Ensete ventricosum TaxID=4639 RepID=A0AAV8PQT9_ENSVE|nr:hypothetical protein OPV22_034767 [Ensete ventricosum]
MCMAKALSLAGCLFSYSTRMHARCASGRNLRASAQQQCRFKARALLQQALIASARPMRKCRRQPRAAAGIASARPVAKCRCERCCSRHCECPSRRQVQMCRIQARAQISSADVSHELQQALREWPSRPQVQMRALLQQAALRVAVPSPSADVQNSAASADFKCRCQPRAAAGIASGRPVPSPSADASAAAAGIASANPMPKCRCAEFSRERCCSRQHCEWPSRPQVQISATRRCCSGGMTGSAAWQWQVQISATSAAAAAV